MALQAPTLHHPASDRGRADLSGVRRYDIISFTTYNDEEATRGSRAGRET